MEYSKSNSKIKVYRYKCAHQNYRKISNEQCNFTVQGTRKRKTKNKAKHNRRGKIGHKIMK